MIDGGADTNILDGTGSTALHRALYWYHFQAEKFIGAFIDSGANLNVQDSRGCTVLHAASENRLPPRVMRKLIEGGANVNIQDSDNRTAIFTVIEDWVGHREYIGEVERNTYEKKSDRKRKRQYQKKVKMLIDAGADVNLQDRHGNTPLNEVVSIIELKVVRMLMKAGADASISDKYGWTPFTKVGITGLIPGITDDNRFKRLVQILYHRSRYKSRSSSISE